MAKKSEQFNAGLNSGASIDSSFDRTLNWLTRGIRSAEKTTLNAMKGRIKWINALQAGAAAADRSMGALTARQQTAEEKGPGGGYAAQERPRPVAGRGGNRLYVAARRAPSAIARGATAGLSWGASTIIGIPELLITANKKLAAEAATAKSYGLSYEQYKAGSLLAGQAGLSGKNFADLVDALSNKIGAQGQTINPQLAQIGLRKSQLLNMPKQQQFDTVMQAITSRVRAGQMTAMQGGSLADRLMGGEASQLATSIIVLNETYDEALKSAAGLNNTTNAEAEGALAASRTLNNIWAAGETALLGMVGEVGKALSPQLKMLENSVLQWIRENKDNIAATIGDWAAGGGPQRLVNGLKLFGDEVVSIAQKLTWLLPDERSPEEMDSIQQAGQRAVEIEEERQAVGSLGYIESLSVANVGEAAWRAAHSHANVPDYVNFADEIFGGAIPAVPLVAPSGAEDKNYVNHNNFVINISMQNGETAEEAANSLTRELGSLFPAMSGGYTFDMQ